MRAVAIAVLLGVVGTTAYAQVPPTKAAEETFAKGRDLMKQKKYTEACEAFEQSQRLDPQYGTQYNLAVCYELDGKLASAWNLFRLLARSDDKPDRRQASADEAKTLGDRVPRIAIAFDNKPADAALQMNGTDAIALVGVQTPVDLGTIKFVASAPGYQTWHHTVNIKVERATVDVIVHLYKTGEKAPSDTLTDDAAAPTGGTGKVDDASPAGGNGAIGGVGSPPPRPEQSETAGAWKGKAGRISLIAGGGATLLGLGFGTIALYEWSKAKDEGEHLPPGVDTTANIKAANDKVHTARVWGDLSTVTVAVGLAGVAAGVYFLLTAPDDEHAPPPGTVSILPSATPDSAGFTVVGRF